MQPNAQYTIDRRTIALLLVALAIPLVWPSLPPLIDLPGHIGRYRVQLDLGHSTALGQYFGVQWRVIPNLGVDLWVMAIAPLIGLEPAVKAIVVLIPVLTGAGFLLIAREIHGRIPATALFALPLAYAWPFQAGFVNFALAMALACLAFGLWLRLGVSGKLWTRAGLFILIGPILWVCHVMGWAFLCVLAFGSGYATALKAGEHWFLGAIRAGLACMPLALPLVLIVAWHEQGAGGTTGWFESRLIMTWLITILRTRWQMFDIFSGAALFLVAAAPLLFRRSLTFDMRLFLPATMLWVFMALIPNGLSGSYFAGVRLIPFAMAITLLSIRPTASIAPRHAKALLFVGFLFFALRMSAQTVDFMLADARNQSNLAALDHIPHGAKIVTQIGQRCGRWLPSRHLLLPQLATARRDAFTNGHWDTTGGQLIAVRYTAGAPFVSNPSPFVDVTGCADRFPPIAKSFPTIPLSKFDYLWVVEVPSTDWPRNPRLVPVWRNGASILYRIMPGGGKAR